MHSASLGEFEQGRPVLQKIKEQYPHFEIVITFFSPSGYEVIKKNREFPHIFYLPMDSSGHAKKWIKMLDPQLVLWIKYEYWHFYLQEIRRKNIPLLMVSGVYRPGQPFFKWYGQFYRDMLACFTHFFVQNQDSKDRLARIIAQEKITVSGDTRCDRVIHIAENFQEVPGMVAFCNNRQVIVAGSTWEDDEMEWTHYVKKNPQIKFIIAPHEIDKENLLDVQKLFPGSCFYSEWMHQQNAETNCLIIDNIGMLARLYHYADITYIGGGFGDNGLHNILEPAVYGKPVLFGPEFEKNFEAQEMIDCGGAISIENGLELEKVVNRLLHDTGELKRRSLAAREYIYKNAGATLKILSYIEKQGFL